MANQQHTERDLYDNCKILSPDGELISRCGDDRAEWYLAKNLATLVELKPFKTVQLNFYPDDEDFVVDEFIIQDRENKCCCCGATELLTLHHVVPKCYRRHFPSKYKSKLPHDVLPLCVECHHRFERHGWELKKEIGEELGIPITGAHNAVVYAARTLCRYGKKMPDEKKAVYEERIKEFFDIDEITEAHLKEAAKLNEKLPTHGKLVVQKLLAAGDEEIKAFIKKWRRDFIEKMEPKFLPKGWGIDYRL